MSWGYFADEGCFNELYMTRHCCELSGSVKQWWSWTYSFNTDSSDDKEKKTSASLDFFGILLWLDWSIHQAQDIIDRYIFYTLVDLNFTLPTRRSMYLWVKFIVNSHVPIFYDSGWVVIDKH